MKVAKKTRWIKGSLLGTGAVMLLHPRPTMYEELSRPVLVDAGANLRTGEIGTLDCGIRIRVPSNA